jgi:hypothetical protein
MKLRMLLPALVALALTASLAARSTVVNVLNVESGPEVKGQTFTEQACDYKALLAAHPELEDDKKLKALTETCDQFMEGLRKGLGKSGADAGTVKVFARIDKFKAGNRAARMWVGYGAGQTELAFKVWGGRSGKRLFSFDVAPKMSSGWTVQRLGLVAGEKAGATIWKLSLGKTGDDD